MGRLQNLGPQRVRLRYRLVAPRIIELYRDGLPETALVGHLDLLKYRARRHYALLCHLGRLLASLIGDETLNDAGLAH